MGDRYTLEYKCVCGYFDDDVYYAPTCGFVDWLCPSCGTLVDLAEHTGISLESILPQMQGTVYNKGSARQAVARTTFWLPSV